MRRNSRILLAIVVVILGGCQRSTNSVFVDLDEVLRQDKPPAWAEIALPNPPPARPALTDTVPGAPAVVLEDPANAPKQSVRDMFKAEQASAFAELQRRLRQFYHLEVQKFQLQQEQSISGEEQKAYAEANSRIRALFDSWAQKRAPIFARLAMIAGFPDPNPTSKPVDKSLGPALKRRNDEASKLRADLRTIDALFDAQSKALLSAVQDKVGADHAALRIRVDEFATQLDKKAEAEATAQIRQATSQLTFKLTNPTPVDLPPTPARQVAIPAETPLEPAPQVPSSGILERTSERRLLLEHELRIWLALNRYTLSGARNGHRDATQEFQKWIQQHGAGP